MTLAHLKAKTRKDLIALARTHRVSGPHAMRKEELIRALLAAVRTSKRAKTATQAAPPPVRPRKAGEDSAAPAQAPKRRLIRATPGRQSSADQLRASVRGPYWVQLRWSLSESTIQRATAALGADWHRSAPVIRVFELGENDTSGVPQRWLRDVEIYGDSDHWYVPVDTPEGTYRFAIGYRTVGGRFFTLARSGTVQTPGADTGSEDGCDAPPVRDDLRSGAGRQGSLSPASRLLSAQLQVDAELVLRGSARPGAEVTCMGRHVELSDDGTFQLRIPLPNGRQVIPAVATLPGCGEQRTVVVAVERNTKELEPRNVNDPIW